MIDASALGDSIPKPALRAVGRGTTSSIKTESPRNRRGLDECSLDGIMNDVASQLAAKTSLVILHRTRNIQDSYAYVVKM